MQYVTDLTGLASIASAGATAVLLLSGIVRLPGKMLLLLSLTLFVLMLIPFGSLPVAAYLRGITGDLSITTLVLMWCALIRAGLTCNREGTGNRIVLLALVALAALILYPMSLGLGTFDPYRLGYGDQTFVIVVLLSAFMAWIWKQYLIAGSISLATLAWTAGWYESGNLWDYLIDPWVAIYALSALTLLGTKKLASLRKQHVPG